MSKFWKKHYDQKSKVVGQSLCKQVGKTVDGVEIDDQQLRYITENIIDILHLGHTDVVVDLCCGNGLITRNIAALVKKVIGVDFSEGLIDTAKSESYSGNITYIASDVLLLPQIFFGQSIKYYMYEALQHFSTEMFVKFLSVITASKRNSEFF